jgi:hypothetical protein
MLHWYLFAKKMMNHSPADRYVSSFHLYGRVQWQGTCLYILHIQVVRFCIKVHLDSWLVPHCWTDKCTVFQCNKKKIKRNGLVCPYFHTRLDYPNLILLWIVYFVKLQAWCKKMVYVRKLQTCMLQDHKDGKYWTSDGSTASLLLCSHLANNPAPCL